MEICLEVDTKVPDLQCIFYNCAAEPTVIGESSTFAVPLDPPNLYKQPNGTHHPFKPNSPSLQLSALKVRGTPDLALTDQIT